MTNPIFACFFACFFSCAIFYPGQLFGEDVIVFDVKKNLPLGPSDPVYKDYFINAGLDAGLKAGMIITVQRRISMHNTLSNKSQGDLVVPVAKLKIIFVQRKLSVARFYSTFSRSGLPGLEYNTIMAGDYLNMSTAAMEVRRKEASNGEFSQQMPIPIFYRKSSPYIL